VDVQIGEAHVNEDNRKEVLKAGDRCGYDKESPAVCPTVLPMARWLRLFLILCGALLVLPARSLAGGPPPPPEGLFRAPPTPTPLPPLPTPTPSRPVVAERTPNPLSYRLFLPRLHTTPLLRDREAITTPTPAAVSTPTAPHSGPPADRFRYTVKPGDTLTGLAIALGRDVKTMACVRQEDGRPVEDLRHGMVIVVPAAGDLCHRVKPGETLARIAAWYGIEVETLQSANSLTDAATLRGGQYLLIPDARSRYRDPEEARIPRTPGNGWRYGDGQFIWPIANGATAITQGFRHGQHMALDIAAEPGTPVYAADTGTVLTAGWSDNGYGYHIVIDHGIDYITLYAHLREYFVKPGDIVKKGDIIGIVGSTGNSTGPHLHFEIRDYGYLIDPLLVLPEN
jgi:murein DD-endopeptidase MepM/ murein hydrolase activator NlpD